MILYTLLTTHTGVDMTNVILTACIVYYIGYNVVAGFVTRDEYNYMSIAAVALIDLYFSNQILQSGMPKARHSRHAKPKPKPRVASITTRKVSKQQTGKRVRINPYPTAVYRYPNNPASMTGGSQPQYPQYQQPQYQQPQYQQPQLPMIDNRELAAELESNNSEDSIESIAVSDTISYSSEEY